MKFTGICCAIAAVCSATSHASTTVLPQCDTPLLREVRARLMKHDAIRAASPIRISETKGRTTTEYAISVTDLANSIIECASRCVRGSERLEELEANAIVVRCALGCAGENPDEGASSNKLVRETLFRIVASYVAGGLDGITPDRKAELMRTAVSIRKFGTSIHPEPVIYTELMERLAAECVLNAPQWIYGFYFYRSEFDRACFDLVQQTRIAEPDRHGWQQRVREPNFEKTLASRLFVALCFLSKPSPESLRTWPEQVTPRLAITSDFEAGAWSWRQDYELKDKMLEWLLETYTLKAGDEWLGHVNSLLDELSTTIPNPEWRLIPTLRKKLAVPITDDAITLAKAIISIAGEEGEFHLKATSRVINCIFGCTEESPISVTPVQILALHLMKKMRPEYIRKSIEGIETIKGKDHIAMQRAHSIYIEDLQRNLQLAYGRDIMAAIKWICGFESFAEAALIRQVYDAEPGRDGWQRRMNRENKAILAARLYELLGEREDCVMLRSRLRLKDEQELRGRSAWLKYVNQLLDTLSAPITSDPTRIRLSESAPLKRATLAALDGISTFVPNPAERLIELITKTLHEKPIIPITEYATNWAKVVVEVLGNAEEDIKYHLVAICRTIGRMLGVEEDPALVMTRILASHIDSYLFKSRIMRDMKEIQETKNYREQQLRCCKNMITSTRWICGLEHPDAIALIRQICDAEPDRVGRQSQMGIEDRAALALSLYELLGVQI